MGKLRPFVRKDSYMPNKKWIPFVIGNGYTTTDGAGGPAPEYETVTGNPVSFNAITPFPLRQLKVAFSPVQSGTGDPSPDNVRPISGWSSLTVNLRGANMLNPARTEIVGNTGTDLSSWTIDAMSNYSYSIQNNSRTGAVTFTETGFKFTAGDNGNSLELPVYVGGVSSFYLGFRYDSTSRLGIKAGFFNASGERTWYDSIFNNYPVIGDNVTSVVNVPSGSVWCVIRFGGVRGTEVEYSNVRIVSDASATFVPYNPLSRSISISLGQTVYSGYVDVISGVGEVTMAKIVLDGTQDELAGFNWRPSANSVAFYYNYPSFNIEIPANIGVKTKAISETQASESYNNLFSNDIDCFAVTTSGGNARICVRVTDTSLTTKEAVNAYLAVHPITIVYPLATPIPIQLTPQEVQSLLGENVMWASSNGDMTVTYRSN